MSAEGRLERVRIRSSADPLVGRETELRAVASLLADPTIRMITITGPSGIGKTSLAVAAVGAAPVAHHVLVAMGAVRDRAVMADAVASELLGPGGPFPPPVDALWQAFGGEPVLLLLDDVDRVEEAADEALSMLDGYPGLRLVSTSLREVGLPGERVLRVGPLDTDDAAQMFVHRLAQRTVATRPDDLDAVREICRAVGGVPLALELAAARASTLPLHLVAEQVGSGAGLGLLDHSAPAPDRHHSLRAALDWTVESLPGPAAALLAAMSVFEGPAPLDAVAAVAPHQESPLDLLSTLLDVSLVELDASSEDPRFVLNPTVRTYAAERLATSGSRREVLRRHDDLVLARCRRGDPITVDEVADVAAALDRALVEGSVDEALDLTLVAARAMSTPGAIATMANRVEHLVDSPERDPVLAARALVWTVVNASPDVDARAYAAWTHERVRRAIATARVSGDTPALLDALELTIRTLPVTLDRELATAGIREGLALAERAGDAGRLARFRMWVGMATLAEGFAEQAAHLLRAAFLDGRSAGDRVATDWAALHLHAMDDPVVVASVPGLPSIEDLLDSAWRHGDRVAAAIALAHLVGRSLDAGDVRTAARHASVILLVGVQHAAAEPLMAATILTVAVRVLVAAGELRDAAVVHSALAPLGELLPRAMSARDHAAYAEAVTRLHEVVPPAGEDERLLLRAAYRVAQRAVHRVAQGAGGGAATHRSPDAGRTAIAGPEALTAREREVLALLADGSGNREVAEVLGISAKTVMHHTVAIYRKLGVRGRTEAATWAIRAGLSREAPSVPG